MGDNTESYGTGCGCIIPVQGGPDELRTISFHPMSFMCILNSSSKTSMGLGGCLSLLPYKISSSSVISSSYKKPWSIFLMSALLTGSWNGALARVRPWLQDCLLPPHQTALWCSWSRVRRGHVLRTHSNLFKFLFCFFVFQKYSKLDVPFSWMKQALMISRCSFLI